MDLAIVVVTWRSAADLRRLLASIERHLGDGPEVIVVDNASGDDPAAALREWPGSSRFLQLGANLGFGVANNRGVELATSERVVLLNPDTDLVDDSLPALAQLAVRRHALAGPRVLNADGSPQPSASGSPVGAWPWVGALVPGALQPRPLRARTEPWRLERTTPVSWLTGACLAAPRELLRRLGPFDESIHLYGEDMDLGLRAARVGVASLFCPDVARVVHHGERSSEQRFRAGPTELIAAGRRRAVGSAYGPARERRAWRAQRLNLRLRAAAKGALGRDASRERAALRAVRSEAPPDRQRRQNR